MGWYERHLLPRIITYGCSCTMIEEERLPIVPKATGRVLELGVGAGANFALYDRARVRELVGIEPSEALRDRAFAAAQAMGLAVEILPAVAEALPFEDQSFDTVISTFTLCTVTDANAALREARRVLRPGGHFLFCEHGRSPDAKVQRWQERLEPVWKRLFGGCHLTRDVGNSVRHHFSVEELNGHYVAKAPRIAGWIEAGVAC